MYIESYWLIIIAVFVIYLLWRVYKLKSTFKQFIDFCDAQEKANTGLIKSLVDIIIYDISLHISKMPKASKRKYLLEKANDLRVSFSLSTVETFPINGKIEKIDDPISYLERILNAPIAISEDYKEVNEEIADVLEGKIEDMKK